MNRLLPPLAYSGLTFAVAFHLGVARAANDYTVSQRGPHHTVWSRVVAARNPDGTVVYRTNSFTELATGLNRLQNGRYVASTPEIVIDGNRATARGAGHEAIFAGNVNSRNAIQIKLPESDGAAWLKGRIFGLAYHDVASGTNVLIAELKDSAGQLVGTNKVRYPDAFTGIEGVDVEYTYRKSGISQCIVFRGAPPPGPEEYGLSADKTHLMVLTEFTEFPTPTVAKRQWTAETERVEDETISFGSSMRMGRGQAFEIKHGLPGKRRVDVTKRWQNLAGRNFLIERVRYREVKRELQSLPSETSSVTNGTASVTRRARWFADGALPRTEKPAANALNDSKSGEVGVVELQFAKSEIANPQSQIGSGFVLDWELVYDDWWWDFWCGNTYLINGEVHISEAAFEPGSVIKYMPSSSLWVDQFTYFYGGECNGTTYTILTSVNDDEHGEWVEEYSTGNPAGGDYGPALVVQQSELASCQANIIDLYGDPGIIASPPPLSTVTVTAPDPVATKNADTGTITITRTGGDWTEALPVHFAVGGTAIPGTDYQSIGTTATIPADEGSVDVIVTAGDQNGGTYDTTVVLTIQADAGYDLASPQSATVTIYDPSTPAPPSVAPPLDLVAWWRGEYDASDALGNHSGNVYGAVGYSYGKVAEGFEFHSVLSERIKVADADALDFGANADFSIEAWIKAESASTAYGVQTIVDKRYTPNDWTATGYAFFLQYGKLGCQLAVNGSPANFGLTGPDLRDGQFHHVAVTVDRDSTTGLKFYVDGVLCGNALNPTGKSGSLVNADFFRIGTHAREALNAPFKGIIDEVSLYNRALSEADIQRVFNAGRGGKFLDVDEDGMADDWEWAHGLNPNNPGDATLDPDGDGFTNLQEFQNKTDPNVALAILSQPPSQTVTVGNDAASHVSAFGDPLYYTWYFYGKPGRYGGYLEVDWDSTFNLSDVQTDDAGTYSVRVANSVGDALSSDPVILTVAPALPSARPTGLVSWWRGEGNSTDELVAHPATEVGDFASGYEGGKVGQAFKLSGDAMYLRVPAFTPLNRFAIEGWFATQDLVPDTSVPILEQYVPGTGERLTVSLICNGDWPPKGTLEVEWVDAQGTHQISSALDAVYFDWSRRSPYGPTFHHVAVTYDALSGGNRIQLFHNGVLAASGGAGASIQLGVADLCFGFSPSASTGAAYFPGKLDELSLYNRPLSQSEILDIYSASVAGKTPLCTAAPDDLVSWWEGQNNGADVFGLNPAIVGGGVTFTRGWAKQAFTFSGTAQVRVPASDSLNVGANADGFTIEAWVNPAGTSKQPLVVWNSGYLTGVSLWLTDQGEIAANIPTLDLVENWLWPRGNVTPGTFNHIVLTYGPDTGDNWHEARLFLNGVELGTDYCLAETLPFTTPDLYLGSNPVDDTGATGTQFAGQMDEVSLYSRALSASEVQALYAAGGGGKCGIAPTIIEQPASQTGNVGNNIVLAVKATGTSLTYQWLFNASQIADATAATLTLNNVQLNQAGNYTVQVVNDDGSVLSSTAVLTVNTVGNGAAPVIDTQPLAQTVCAGSPLNLSVAAHGSGTLRYQWCKNGINIAGATAASYTRAQAAPADGGTYSVVVYDNVGHLASANVSVTVYPRPTARVIGDTTIQPGMYAAIGAILSGTPPWTITWSDGDTKSGITDNPYWRAVAPSTTRDYSVTALSDAYCSAVAADISGGAHVVVSGPSVQPTLRAGIIELSGTYNNFTFASDQTYYVNETITLTGTTRIEGGTVVKLSSSTDARIVITGNNIVCDTGPYRPAIFTCADDDNYGYYYWYSTGEPSGSYGRGISLAFTAASPVTLQHLRFFNLGGGVSIEGGGTFNFRNCQFVDCDAAITQAAVTANVNVFNALFTGNTTVFAPNAGGTPHLVFQHITVDDCVNFVSPAPASGTWQGANSLLINVAGSTPGTLPNNCKALASANGVFQTAVDGSYYLADGSTYRGAGTTSIDSTLLAELPQKTTHPPLFLSWLGLSGEITLMPQVPRCTNATPDIGYCYDALDYVLGAVFLTGGHIEVLPGTAVGLSYDYVSALDLWEGSSITAKGTASKPITLAPTTAVQEGPFAAWWPGMLVSFVPDYWPNEQSSPAPACDFRFVNAYLSSGICHHFWGGRGPLYFGMTMSACSSLSLRMQDCQLRGGWLDLGEPHYRVIWPVDYGGEVIAGSVLWHNNLFDRVNINLDPDTGPVHWAPVGTFENPTVDLQLVATNNTFHGGFLAMTPVPASAGNWAFENNLFDKVVFAQDANLPLDFDYNAYWPCVGVYPDDPDGELLPGQTGTLNETSDAADVNGPDLPVLASAPSYQSGPLGSFYLPAGTALDGSGHGTPGDVGLYHYTTRVDQTKEGEETGNVNVGFHYVATVSLGSMQPKDSDAGGADGIPDYVEDADGDNAAADITEGRETSPALKQTSSGTDDSMNAIYDDIDLDGDGMTGALEKVLNKNPLLSDNPLTLTHILTGEEPNIATFSLPVSYNTAIVAGSVDLTVNGTSGTLQKAEQAMDGTCRLVWNTTYESPGHLFLQPRLILNRSAFGVSGLNAGPLLAFASPNVVRFSESTAIFDAENGAILFARLPQNEANYVIRIYDPSNPDPFASPIKTITGSTTDGRIEANWNLVRDDTSSAFTGNRFRANYAITLLDPPASGANDQIVNESPVRVVDDNKFNVAYTSDLPSLAQKGGPEWVHTQLVVDTLMQHQDPTKKYSSDFNVFTTSVWPPPYPGYVQTREKAIELKNLLPNAKNFYYMGHGSPNLLFDKNGPGLNAYLTVQEVAAALENTADPRSGIVVKRPYRFVFINGCQTASTKAWQHAFGFLDIEDAPLARTDVRGPQAFIAWVNPTSGPDKAEEWNDKPFGSPEPKKGYGSMLEEFYAAWMNDVPLLYCLGQAMDQKKYAWPLPVPSNKNIYNKLNEGDTRDYTSPLRFVGRKGITRRGAVDIQ